MALKTSTPPRPKPVIATPRVLTDATAATRYVSLPDSEIDASEPRGRSLPPTIEIRRRQSTSSSSQPFSSDRELDAAEERLWGESSELVKKLPTGVAVDSDDADKAPSVVISNEREIISQG